MCRLMLLTCISLMMSTIASAQMPKGSLQEQSQMLRDEGKEGASLYAKLLQKGEDPKTYAKLGDVFMDHSRPVQAELYYKAALKLEKDLEIAKSGLKNASSDLKSKRAKIEELYQAEKKKADHLLACRRAAIFFHLGYQGDAMDILDEAGRRYGQKDDINGLLSTFKQGIGMDRAIIKAALVDFDKSVKNGKLESALTHFGELLFFNLGSNPYDGVVEKLLETFPSKVDREKLARVLAVGEL